MNRLGVYGSNGGGEEGQFCLGLGRDKHRSCAEI